MTPKYLLKFRLCVSSLEDFGPNSSFQRLIPDPALPNVKKARKIIFCSGKVYYDLFQERERLFPHGDYVIINSFFLFFILFIFLLFLIFY